MLSKKCSRTTGAPIAGGSALTDSAGRPLTRRRLVKNLGLAAGALAAPAFIRGRSQAQSSSLFTLGVASGDPSSRSVILWTRLAPDPLNGGGMGGQVVDVHWRVATDPDMTQVIRRGTSLAHPRNGHTVHAPARSLPSNTWLYYQFEAMGEKSRVGRTRTFPATFEEAFQVRFALVSCQNYQQGFYPAYRDMLQQELDFVVHVGDYIYEEGPLPPEFRLSDERIHGPQPFTVEDYRNTYARYRLDPNLQEAHAQLPFITTWDDHEVDDNYAGLIPADDQTLRAFRERRKAAYQVYSESMPLRPENRFKGGKEITLYRRLNFGDLAAFYVLDTRQFRTDQPCDDGFKSLDPVPPATGLLCEDPSAVDDPNATMTGEAQERWLTDGLRRSNSVWNVVAQQVMMMPWNIGPAGVPTLFNMDAWDGYRAARQRLMGFLEAERPSNPVVLTGDIHSAWAANLLADSSDPESDALAAEFVCTSISSSFADNSEGLFQLVEGSIPANPHVQFFNPRNRGYCICDVGRFQWDTEFREVVGENPDLGVSVALPNSPVETGATASLRSGFNAPGNGGQAVEV